MNNTKLENSIIEFSKMIFGQLMLAAVPGSLCPLSLLRPGPFSLFSVFSSPSPVLQHKFEKVCRRGRLFRQTGERKGSRSFFVKKSVDKGRGVCYINRYKYKQ